jgi:uncharacterized DUF497 family protein
VPSIGVGAFPRRSTSSLDFL